MDSCYCLNCLNVRLFRSGTEALYAEKEDLLHEVMDLEARKSSQKTPRVQVRVCDVSH